MRWRPDGDGVCAETVVEGGDVKGTVERPLVVESVHYQGAHVSPANFGTQDGRKCSPFVGLFFVLTQLEDMDVALAKRVVDLPTSAGEWHQHARDETGCNIEPPLGRPPKARSVHCRGNKSTPLED